MSQVNRSRRRAANVAAWALACLLALTMLAPFLWMLSTSLMDELEVFRFPPRLLPESPRWENYEGALSARPFGRYFLNSFVFATCIVIGQLFTAATAGYAFAKFAFTGRDKLFLLFLSTMMVPAVVVMIPRFLLIDALGWIDTYTGLVSTELVLVWGIFLMRQYFRSVPKELMEEPPLASRRNAFDEHAHGGSGHRVIPRHVRDDRFQVMGRRLQLRPSAFEAGS